MRIHIFKLVAPLALIFLVGGLSAATTEDQSIAEPEGHLYSSKTLEILKDRLPDLHSKLLAPEWSITDGYDRIQIVAASTLTALGADREEIIALNGRLDQFELQLQGAARDEVSPIMRAVAHGLVGNFVAIEMERQVTVQLVEIYSSLFEESHPSAIQAFRECLNSSLDRIGTKSTLYYGYFVKALNVPAIEDRRDPVDRSVSFNEEMVRNLSGLVNESGSNMRMFHDELDISGPGEVENEE